MEDIEPRRELTNSDMDLQYLEQSGMYNIVSKGGK